MRGDLTDAARLAGLALTHTVQVPMKATASGFATVLLQPETSDQGFIWYGADVRKL